MRRSRSMSWIDRQLRPRDIVDERVLAAMAAVPRDEFVPEAITATRRPTTGRCRSASARPSPSRTSSAWMTQELDVRPAHAACSRSARAPDIRRRCLRSWAPRCTASRSSPSCRRARGRRSIASGSTLAFTCASVPAMTAGPRSRRSIASSLTAAPPEIPGSARRSACRPRHPRRAGRNGLANHRHRPQSAGQRHTT